MLKKCSFVLVFIITMPVYSSAEDAGISKLYDSAGVTGSILIQSLDGEIEYSNNLRNVDERYVPASTFKIPHTLIALEEGAIKDQIEVILWDGVTRGYAPWNKDQTLATAFAHSCVWCYQGFTKQISDSTYKQYLRAFDYGNRETGSNTSHFWLDGDVRISVRDQVSFLRKVYRGELLVKPKSIAILKDIMQVEQTPSYSLWAKTGWQGSHGWYVGYVEAGDKVWLFAHHVDIKSRSELVYRQKITLDALKLKGIIPELTASSAKHED